MAFTFPLQRESELKERLQELKNKHQKAGHFCFAYRIGINGENYRTSDDGEPSGSAGNPILGQLLSFEITNCLVVVVRYFGGVKLGVGGLINAYKTATHEALSKATIIEKEIKVWYSVSCDYKDLAQINLWIKQEHLEVIEQNFDLICTFKVGISTHEELMWDKRFELIKTMKYEKLGIY